ncbi:MAG: DUF2199 domain-containing protein [Candidatus Competibacterales bacterium]|nr:DUF2199 domain-containing protein [Candidatus Competibacterales bacterium]
MNSDPKNVICPECGQEHSPMDMEAAFEMPDDYFYLDENERKNRGKISSDFCQLDERYFVRSVIPIPVTDQVNNYCWGVWVELSKDDFLKVFDTWEEDDVTHIPKLKGKLANDLPEYESTIDLEGELELRSDTRPLFYVIKESRLKRDQENGVTTDDTARYYHYFA